MADVKALFDQFHEIAVSPRKQLDQYLAQGKKAVGCVPVYTPEEIVHSMGLVPMGLWGADMELKESKSYFPAFICSIMQSVLELGINGAYKGLSAIIVPALCDSLKSLGQNWKYAVTDIPFIPMSYPQNRRCQAGPKFTKAGYERVIEDLQVATGAKFSDVALAKSNAIYNEHNQVMREFAELVGDYPSVTASQRSDVFKSAWFMLKEEHTAMVRELIAALKEMPKETSGKKRIITSGILADSPSLLSIFDENDMQIVGDDVAAESRQYRVDVEDAPSALDGLVNKFTNMDHCSVLYDVDKKRADYIVEMARRTKADGVVVVLTKFCDPEEFDYVILKKAFDAADIPSVLIEVDRQMVNYEQAKTMIQTFKEMLN